MKALFNESKYQKVKSNELLNLQCYQCNEVFSVIKRIVTSARKGSSQNACKFCSQKCKSLYQNKKEKFNCENCNKEFERCRSQIKSKRVFCCQSCSTLYNNAHKTHGTRRSKLEVYLEEQLKQKYANLEIHFNRKDTINSELDIYIPSLKVAFELNGIYHYEPIYGPDKLSSIQNNDNRKFQACLEKQIELCIIDTSKFKNFKEEKAKEFLNIIEKIIQQKLVISQL